MNFFSHRYGYKSIKDIQYESVDIDLRNRLWNQINTLAPPLSEFSYHLAPTDPFFKKSLDRIFSFAC
jgi:hypothetical protein